MRIKIFTTLLFLFSFLKITAQTNYTLELNTKTAPTEKMTRNETELDFGLSTKVNAINTITNTLKYKQIGVNYELAKYDLGDNLNRFTSLENKFELAHEIDSKTSVAVAVQPTANFEKSFSFKDVMLLASLQIKHTFNDTNSFSIGAQRTTLFGKIAFVPTFSYSNKINNNTTVQIGFPNSQISYSNNKRNTFLINNDFQGSIYNLATNQGTNNYNGATRMAYSQMATTVGYVRNIDSFWSINLSGGYGFNNKYYLTDDEANVKYDFNNNNGYIFNIGIKFKH